MPKKDIELLRLVDRITYGASRQFVSIAESMGYEAFLDWQLQPENIDDDWLEDALLEFLPTLAMDAEELADFVFEQQNFAAAQRDQTLAVMIRQIFSPRQLYERMVEFWTDHFNVPMNSVVSAYLKSLEDRQVIRVHALGRFGDLLQASAKSPAMLYYLDNFSSTAQGPNENYARELLELHTLGVKGGYSEKDIKETARVFTGWTIEQPAAFRFAPGIHDSGSKVVLGEEIWPAGVSEGEALLERIAGMEPTARHLADKLIKRFIADVPDPELVEAVSQSYLDSDGDIRSMLRTLFMHPNAVGTIALKFKRPNEYSAALLRGLEVELNQGMLTRHYEAILAGGQVPFSWPAPNGFPDERAYWQSSNGMLMRFNQSSGLTDPLFTSSGVLAEAAQRADLMEQIDVLETALRPQGLNRRERVMLIRSALDLDVTPSRRAGILAGWITGSPYGQWR